MIFMENGFVKLKNFQIDFFLSTEKIEKKIIMPRLCHGNALVTVQTGQENMEYCDALETSRRDMHLGVATADCAAICFGDGEKIAIAHIGWRGLAAGLIEKMLQRLNKTALEIYVGPHLFSFEIQKDYCYEALKQKFGEAYFHGKHGRIEFNFKEAIASLLPKGVIFDERNTKDDFRLPSFRRDKATIRLITSVSFT